MQLCVLRGNFNTHLKATNRRMQDVQSGVKSYCLFYSFEIALGFETDTSRSLRSSRLVKCHKAPCKRIQE